MKRGNTALKRVVSVASVAAMAIAGAVLAAPAASAYTDPATDGAIRATPVANATYVNAAGAVLDKQNFAVAAYADAASSTGAVPTIPAGSTNGLVSSVQYLVAADAVWPGAPITFTFSQPLAGRPSVSISPKPVVADDLDNVAGWAGNDGKATEASLADPLSTSAPVKTVSNSAISAAWASATPEQLVVSFNGTNPNATLVGAGAYYIVTISNARVVIPDDEPAAAITVDDGTDATTVGYVGEFSLSAPSTYASNTAAVALGDVTIKELNKVGFADAGVLTLTASANGTALDFVEIATPSAANYAKSATLNDPTLDIGSGAADEVTVTLDTPASTAAPDANESITLKGLSVKGVPFGADIVLSLTNTSGFDGAAVNDKNFSQTANQGAAATATVKAATEAPRIAGSDRYATAAQIATAFGTSNNAVVLANGLTAKDGADALAANFLAGTTGAPILLTDSAATLPTATQLALVSIFKGATGDSDGNITIYAMGGTDSVSDAALNQAKSIADTAAPAGVVVKVERVAGSDRYETAAKAAAKAVAIDANAVKSYSVGGAFDKTAILASGQVNADALAAGALSWNAGIPVLLTTDADTLPATVSSTITDLKIKNVIVLGGTDRVSEAAVKSLTDNGVTVKRIAGADRFETAVDLAEFATSTTSGLALDLSGTVFLANGREGFPDALAVGPLAGDGGNIVLTVSDADALPATVKSFLEDNAADLPLTNIKALGSTDRVSDKAIAEAQKAIGQD